MDAPEGVQGVIEDAQRAGVAHMLVVAVDLTSHEQLLALARSHACISTSVGLHPNAETPEEPDAATLAALAADPLVVAVGETGLDYFRSSGDLDWQRARFREHIHAARELGKPLIIHSREARTDVLDILEQEGADAVGGVMHCFVDDWVSAERAMALNFYISFSGIVTFRNAQALQDVAKRVPLDRLLVETDAPYLAPVPKRGKPNRPAWVRHVAEFLSGLRGEPLEQLAAQTTANFQRLFRVEKLN